MEIKNDNAAMLSNYEVFSLLQDIENGRNGQQKPNKFQNNLSTICYSTMKFLKETPCNDQTPEILSEFMQRVEPFKLTKAEKLQLLNQRPKTAVEIQLLIEESEERMSEDQIGQLLDIIATVLPGDDPPEVAEDEEEVDQEEEQMDE